MRIAALSVIASATLMAGGYAIPESSINATALSAAYVAASSGADAAYYNPAAMVYNDDANIFEFDTTYIGLSSIDFSSGYNSKKEDFLVPTIHFTSKKLCDSGIRAGFSVVAPGGLSKRWENSVPKATAEEFTLKTIEFNPSLAVPLSNSLSMGVGARVISSSGIVKSSAAVSRDMEGTAINYGYNLALLYKPTHELNLAATYRSKIDLSIEGNAKLYSGASLVYNGDVSVSVPLPAALNLAASYMFNSGTTVEAVYERTYWSAYKNLDFNYPVSIGALTSFFDDPKAKNWKDTNTYRLGLTKKMDKLTAMAGIAYDQTPVPESTLGYELPDADAWIYSLGTRYQIDSHWNVGLAGLVDMKKDRAANNSSIHGEFSNARAYLVTAGIEYRF